MDDKTRLVFEPIAEPFDSVRKLGSLRFDLRDQLGPRAFVDLSDIRSHRALGRDLVAALYEHARPSRVSSDKGIGSYGASIRELLSYCLEKGIPDNWRLRDLGTEFLLDYRAHLKVTLAGMRSEVLRRRYGNLQRLIEAGQQLGLVHPEMAVPRNYRHVRDANRTQPYSPGEALDIEAACRDHIRELLLRLDEGRQLLERGEDPRRQARRDPRSGRLLPVPDEDRPWNQLHNLIWYVVNVLDGRYYKRQELLELGGHSSFINAITGAWKGVYRSFDVYGRLYPVAEDLIPFIVLLAKKTGRNESSILGLRRDCLTKLDDQYFVWYEKRRGGSRLYRKPIADDGPFSPVGLIKLLQSITAPLATRASQEHQDYLLLGLTLRGRGREPIKPLDASYVKDQMNRVGGWCDQRELADAHGKPQRISLRSMRVFYLAERYKKTGHLGQISRDASHRQHTTTETYLNNESMVDFHEKAVEDGIRNAVDLAKKPAVVVEDEPDSISTALGIDLDQAQSVYRGEQDVFFASCRDFYNRPGGPRNTPCDQPWGCLTCSNAIITRHVLPRILAFRRFLEQQREELSREDWEAKFSAPWHVINSDVLPKFPREVVADAARLAEEEILYVPLAAKVR